MSRWVPVLVRLEDYEEITSLVAEREAHRPEDGSQAAAHIELGGPVTLIRPSSISDPDGEQLAAQTPWEIADLRKLAEGTSRTAQRWTKAMDVCCEVAESEYPWLGTSEIAARTGMTISEWRDAPRKMTRHLKANYPDVPVDSQGNQVWPLLAKSKAGSSEVHWAMNVEQARRWRRVRGIES